MAKQDHCMEELISDVAVLKSELKTLVAQHSQHCQDDKDTFRELLIKLSRIERLVYIGFGVVVTVQFFLGK